MSDGENINQNRRRFLTVATSVVGATGAAFAAVPFIGSWFPSAKARALGAPIQVNLANIEPGQMITEEWRGKPVYVIRRTKEALDALASVEDQLRDPESVDSVQPEFAQNTFRTPEKKEEFLVLLGVCTHLGCAPQFVPEVGVADLGGDSWKGGFFCPCHGSKFDMSGRVYQGVPAPTNLEVPPYRYDTDTVITVGDDQGGSQ